MTQTPRARLRLVTPEEAPVASPIEQLFRNRVRFVSGIAYRLLGRDDEIDDVVQDVFLALVRQQGRVRFDDDLDAFLAKVTVRAVGKRLRWRRLRKLVHLDDSVNYHHMASADTDPADRVLIERIYRVLDGVPAEERLAWSVRHLQGEDLQTVARTCDCSLATAKRRVAAAHARILRKLGAVK